MEEPYLTSFLWLFVEAEEKVKVTSDGSKNDACLEMARGLGQLDRVGIQEESLGVWARDRIWKTWNSQGRISELIPETTRNLGVLKQIGKRLWSWQFYWWKETN